MRLLVIAALVTACVRAEPLRASGPRAVSPVVAPAPVIIAPVLLPSPTTLPPPAAASAEAPPAPASAEEPPVAASAEAPVVAAADPREATRKAAHDALAEHCGQCHEGHRSTNAKALAVYDLDKPDWPERFDDRRSQGALRRLAKSPAARDAFIAFRDAERAASSKTP